MEALQHLHFAAGRDRAGSETSSRVSSQSSSPGDPYMYRHDQLPSIAAILSNDIPFMHGVEFDRPVPGRQSPVSELQCRLGYYRLSQHDSRTQDATCFDVHASSISPPRTPPYFDPKRIYDQSCEGGFGPAACQVRHDISGHEMQARYGHIFSDGPPYLHADARACELTATHHAHTASNQGAYKSDNPTIEPLPSRGEVSPLPIHRPFQDQTDEGEDVDGAVEQELFYQLEIREQPRHARAIGHSQDERTLDPTPILQLKIKNINGQDLTEQSFSRENTFVHAELYSADQKRSAMHIRDVPRSVCSNLAGPLVSTGNLLRDEHNELCCFFCFPDLACRNANSYRLRFLLLRTDLTLQNKSPILGQIFSDVFHVVAARNFGGRLEPSLLAITLKVAGKRTRLRRARNGAQQLQDQAGPRRGRRGQSRANL